MAKKALKEKEYVSITKLLCDFATFLRERTKCNLLVPEKCGKCGKDFEGKDIIYVAKLEDGSKEIICKDCSKE